MEVIKSRQGHIKPVYCVYNSLGIQRVGVKKPTIFPDPHDCFGELYLTAVHVGDIDSILAGVVYFGTGPAGEKNG